VTPGEVLSEVLKDNVFFDQSGGGVTFSGGEPLMQPEFLESTMRLSKEAGLMTAVDTSGFAPWEVIERIIPFCDLFLYDIKHMDDAVHRELVGVSNGLILENLGRLTRTGKEVVARLPVIPGVNDQSTNIENTAEFLSSLGISEITVLPYHDIGKEKYERLGRDYALVGLSEPSDRDIERVVRMLRGFGLRVAVSGRP
jgi:pyruvate formate lyase activating enzyme